MQLMAAAVGAVVGVVVLHPVNIKAAGVFTTRLTAVEAEVPALGVAIKVPV